MWLDGMNRLLVIPSLFTATATLDAVFVATRSTADKCYVRRMCLS